MKVFSPLRMYESPSRIAVVRMAAGVGARAGLGEGVGAQDLAPGQARQVLLFLLLAAEVEDRLRVQRAVHLVDDRGNGARPGQLLDDDRVAHPVHAAAVGLRQMHVQVAVFGQKLEVRPGELVLPVELGRARCDLLFRQFPDRLPHHVLLFGQEEVHGSCLLVSLLRGPPRPEPAPGNALGSPMPAPRERGSSAVGRRCRHPGETAQQRPRRPMPVPRERAAAPSAPCRRPGSRTAAPSAPNASAPGARQQRPRPPVPAPRERGSSALGASVPTPRKRDSSALGAQCRRPGSGTAAPSAAQCPRPGSGAAAPSAPQRRFPGSEAATPSAAQRHHPGGRGSGSGVAPTPAPPGQAARPADPGGVSVRKQRRSAAPVVAHDLLGGGVRIQPPLGHLPHQLLEVALRPGPAPG